MKTRMCWVGLALTLVAGASCGGDEPGAGLSENEMRALLKVRVEQVAGRPAFQEGKRSRLEPLLMKIAWEYASATNWVGIEGDTREFEHVLFWLSNPPNAEALIPVNEILKNELNPYPKSAVRGFLKALELRGELRLPLEGGVKRLREYLANGSATDPQVSFLMARALAQSGDSSGREALVSRLADEKETVERRCESARCILRLDSGEKGALAFLREQMEKNSLGRPERLRTGTFLYESGDSLGASWMNDLLSSECEKDALWAAQFVGKKGDLRSVRVMARLLKSEDKGVRDAATAFIRRHVKGGVLPASSDSSDIQWDGASQMFEIGAN